MVLGTSHFMMQVRHSASQQVSKLSLYTIPGKPDLLCIQHTRTLHMRSKAETIKTLLCKTIPMVSS